MRNDAGNYIVYCFIIWFVPLSSLPSSKTWFLFAHTGTDPVLEIVFPFISNVSLLVLFHLLLC